MLVLGGRGGGPRSRCSSLRRSLGDSERQRSEMVNVQEERVRALGLSEPSRQSDDDIVYVCRYARGTRLLDVERSVLADRLSD